MAAAPSSVRRFKVLRVITLSRCSLMSPAAAAPGAGGACEASCHPFASRSGRINDLNERESMEVHVPRADPAYAMLAHEDSGVCVVHEVSRQMGKLADDLPGDVDVSQRRDKDAQPW